jgi:hypothetical protein
LQITDHWPLDTEPWACRKVEVTAHRPTVFYKPLPPADPTMIDRSTRIPSK